MPHSDRTGAGGAAIPTPFLVLGMLVAGCANSLLTKYQDMQCVSGCAKGSLSKRENFEQPVWQSLNMFVGEALCLIVIAVRHLSSKRSGDVRKDVGYTALAQDEDDNEQQDMPSPTGRPLTAASRLLFAIPSLCDMAGTTAMNVGLILVPVSVYQMSRGALVLWVGVLSVIFLHRKLRAHQWAALVAVVAGVALVGLAGSLAQKAPASATHQSLALLRRAAVAVAEAIDPEDPLRVIAGVLLITGAQIFTATQFVVEEKILSVYHVEPLEAVGLEGAAGLILVLLAMPILHVTLASRSGYFDIPLGFHQIISNGVILGLSFAICISIAIFNLTGIAITRRVSAAARCVHERYACKWVLKAPPRTSSPSLVFYSLPADPRSTPHVRSASGPYHLRSAGSD